MPVLGKNGPDEPFEGVANDEGLMGFVESDPTIPLGVPENLVLTKDAVDTIPDDDSGVDSVRLEAIFATELLNEDGSEVVDKFQSHRKNERELEDVAKVGPVVTAKELGLELSAGRVDSDSEEGPYLEIDELLGPLGLLKLFEVEAAEPLVVAKELVNIELEAVPVDKEPKELGLVTKELLESLELLDLCDIEIEAVVNGTVVTVVLALLTGITNDDVLQIVSLPED